MSKLVKFFSFSCFMLSSLLLLNLVVNAQCFSCDSYWGETTEYLPYVESFESYEDAAVYTDAPPETQQLAPQSLRYFNPNPTYSNLHNYNIPYYYSGGAWDSSMAYHYNGYEKYNHHPFNTGKTDYSRWREGGRYIGYERGGPRAVTTP